MLTGVSQTTAFTAKKGESGIYPTSYFTSVAPGSKFVSAAGKWLDAPEAALYGASSPGNNQSVVLLTLGSPSYDPAGRVRCCPSPHASLMCSWYRYLFKVGFHTAWVSKYSWIVSTTFT